jgi:hypothetical protein
VATQNESLGSLLAGAFAAITPGYMTVMSNLTVANDGFHCIYDRILSILACVINRLLAFCSAFCFLAR